MAEEERRPDKPFDNKFMQQKLDCFHYPQFSPLAVILTLFITTIVFVSLGGTVLVMSGSIYEKRIRYDQINSCTYSKNDATTKIVFDGNDYTSGCVARVTFTLDEYIDSPVYIFYELRGVYQNFRDFTDSMIENQLDGSVIERGSASSYCRPIEGPDGEEVVTVNGNNIPMEKMIYRPCGMVAYSMFNDSIALYKADSNTVPEKGTWDKTGATLICDGAAFDSESNQIAGSPEQTCEKKDIALSVDRNARFDKFEATENEWTSQGATSSNQFLVQGYYNKEVGHKIPSMADEDFMVWSRFAALPEFRKPYRRITSGLEKGTYAFEINEQWDAVSFGAEKHVILATVNGMGGKHFILGAVLVALGVLSFISAVAFLAMYILPV